VQRRRARSNVIKIPERLAGGAYLDEESPKQPGRSKFAECPLANLPEKKACYWGVGLTASKMAECRSQGSSSLSNGPSMATCGIAVCVTRLSVIDKAAS